MLLTLFAGFSILAASLTAAAKHGTIGYGINMFHPYCCTACSDSLAMVYLNCTVFSESSEHSGMGMKKRMDMDMGMTGTTSPECYASDQPWKQTLSYCIKSHCDGEGISAKKQDHCFQKVAAVGLSVGSLEDSLPDTAPTKQLAEDAMWLNKTMLVNEEYWQADRGTIEAFETSEQDHVKFSIVIMALSVGVPVLSGLWAFLRGNAGTSWQTSSMAIRVQSLLSLPAFLGQRHLEPLPYSIGYVPQRALSIWIAIYVILNVVFSAVPFYSVQPSSWFTNRNQEIGAYVANRTGVLSFANMALAILFSARNNPLAYFSDWTHTSFLAFHRWASRVAILQAIVHSIVYTADYCYWREPGDYYTEAKLPYFWWGIIATTAMGLMAGLSAFPVRKYAYELFLVLHIVLAILSLVGSWYHVQLRFTKNWGYEVWLYLAFAFWSYDRLVRLVKVVYYSRFGSSYAIASPVLNTNIVGLKVFPGNSWRSRPGGHTFLYFPSSGRFWENHPFTVADWATGLEESQSMSSTHSDSSDNETAGTNEKLETRTTVSQRALERTSRTEDAAFHIQCYFRVHAGTTSRLYRKLAAQGPSRIPIMTEGPYGSHALSHEGLKSASKILCIAGGIGITWATGFAKQFSAEKLNASSHTQKMMPRARRFTLAWTVRERELLEHVRHHNLPDLTAAGLDDGSLSYQFWLTGKDHSVNGTDKEVGLDGEQTMPMTIGSRMDVLSIVSSFMEDGETHAVLFCGPGGLADMVRKSAVACSKKGYAVDLFEEKFAW